MLQSPRRGLSSLADEPRRSGRASNITRSTCRISKSYVTAEAEETVSSRDEIGPEILKTYEKLGIRLPVVTVHECMERRVIARSRRARSRRLLQFRKSACILRSGTVPAMSRRPTSRLHYSPSGDGDNEARAKVAQHVSAWRTEEIILTNATEAIELAARRGAGRTQAVRPDHPFDPGAIRPWQFLSSLIAL